MCWPCSDVSYHAPGKCWKFHAIFLLVIANTFGSNLERICGVSSSRSDTKNERSSEGECEAETMNTPTKVYDFEIIQGQSSVSQGFVLLREHFDFPTWKGFKLKANVVASCRRRRDQPRSSQSHAWNGKGQWQRIVDHSLVMHVRRNATQNVVN